jgi:hypothetical protein
MILQAWIYLNKLIKILSCPLDAFWQCCSKIGLLNRKQNDSKALLELDTSLRLLDPKDPVKYDFALFGLGIFLKVLVLKYYMFNLRHIPDFTDEIFFKL